MWERFTLRLVAITRDSPTVVGTPLLITVPHGFGLASKAHLSLWNAVLEVTSIAHGELRAYSPICRTRSPLSELPIGIVTGVVPLCKLCTVATLKNHTYV